MESQIPSISHIIGNRITAAIWKTSVRIKDITADVSPSFNAVKKEEPNTEKPESRKENEKIENAWFVILKSSASYPTNIPDKGADKSSPDKNITIAQTPIIPPLFLKRLLSSALFFAPKLKLTIGAVPTA